MSEKTGERLVVTSNGTGLVDVYRATIALFELLPTTQRVALMPGDTLEPSGEPGVYRLSRAFGDRDGAFDEDGAPICDVVLSDLEVDQHCERRAL